MQPIGPLFDVACDAECQQEHSPVAPVIWRLVDIPWRRTQIVSLAADIGILSDRHGPQCQISLSGRITIDSSPELRLLFLQRLQSPNCRSLTVDLYEVAYIDTSGLAILVEILKAAHAQGKTFHLSRLRERPRYLLEATRMLHLFDEPAQEAPQLKDSLSKDPQ